MTSRANGGPGSTAKRKSKTPGKPVKIHWQGHKSIAENASEKLPEMARGFFEAGGSLGPDASFKALHRFRLLTKRFRYTLELFRPCYGSGLEQRIEALRRLQQYLGEINDCATTQALLVARDSLPEAERDRLVCQVAKLAGSRIAKFQRHWQRDFAAQRRENWWIDYLVRFAGRQRR